MVWIERGRFCGKSPGGTESSMGKQCLIRSANHYHWTLIWWKQLSALIVVCESKACVKFMMLNVTRNFANLIIQLVEWYVCVSVQWNAYVLCSANGTSAMIPEYHILQGDRVKVGNQMLPTASTNNGGKVPADFRAQQCPLKIIRSWLRCTWLSPATTMGCCFQKRHGEALLSAEQGCRLSDRPWPAGHRRQLLCRRPRVCWCRN